MEKLLNSSDAKRSAIHPSFPSSPPTSAQVCACAHTPALYAAVVYTQVAPTEDQSLCARVLMSIYPGASVSFLVSFLFPFSANFPISVTICGGGENQVQGTQRRLLPP